MSSPSLSCRKIFIKIAFFSITKSLPPFMRPNFIYPAAAGALLLCGRAPFPLPPDCHLVLLPLPPAGRPPHRTAATRRTALLPFRVACCRAPLPVPLPLLLPFRVAGHLLLLLPVLPGSPLPRRGSRAVPATAPISAARYVSAFPPPLQSRLRGRYCRSTPQRGRLPPRGSATLYNPCGSPQPRSAPRAA